MEWFLLMLGGRYGEGRFFGGKSRRFEEVNDRNINAIERREKE
jgi:hypothetical protein